MQDSLQLGRDYRSPHGCLVLRVSNYSRLFDRHRFQGSFYSISRGSSLAAGGNAPSMSLKSSSVNFQPAPPEFSLTCSTLPAFGIVNKLFRRVRKFSAT